MTDIQNTIADIVSKRNASLKTLSDAYTVLTTAKQAIIVAAGGNPLSDADIARINALDTNMTALTAANTALGIVSVYALNQSAQAKALARTLDTINTGLENCQVAINGIATAITAMGSATKQVDALLQSAVTLAALFP